MCGRFALTLPPEALRRLFGFVEQPNLAPRYNIAPTQPVAIIRAVRENGATIRHWAHARWGFLPAFVKDPKEFPLLFNARSEGVGDRASFRNAVRRRRCLVPADAFYEWRHATGGTRRGAKPQPFMARRTDGAPIGLAGLWETWTGPNGEEVDTACILTTAANEISAAIHPRLPAVIEPKDFAAWLDPDEAAVDDALMLLKPAAAGVLAFVPVGDAVNKVDRDGPEVQEPASPPEVSPRSVGEVQPSLF